MSLAFIPPAKPQIGSEEIAAVTKVLESAMLAQGSQVAAFEEEFGSALVACRPCVAVNSGTSGLHLGLLAAGVGPGDEVIVPSFTFAASANSIAITGATPVFVDIEPDFFCLDPEAVEAAITPRTKGIMVVHLYGHPANMTRIQEIAAKHGLDIYEDSAQSHGATWQGQQVGTFGAFAMFSLYPTKNMTSGEGGMISCGTPEIRRLARLLRNQGMEAQYQNEIIGLNNRMTDIHAAIGREQLKKLPAWNLQRAKNAAFLSENLQGVKVPPVAVGATHVYHQYTIQVQASERDEIVRRLREEFQVGCGVYYPIPCHKLQSLANFAPSQELENTMKVAKQVISLPVHPALSQDDLQRIVEAVNTLAGAGA